MSPSHSSRAIRFVTASLARTVDCGALSLVGGATLAAGHRAAASCCALQCLVKIFLKHI